MKLRHTPGMKSPWKRLGGKANLSTWIIGNLPPHEALVDAFGGAGNIVLNAPPAKGAHVYNDLDGTWTNSFIVAREHGDELARLIEETPYSRNEFNRALDMLENWEEIGLSALQRAWAHLVVVRGSFSATGRTWSTPQLGSKGNTGAWNDLPEMIRKTMAKMKTIAIENLDYRKLFGKYDDETACWYCDPPYVGCEKEYYEANKKDGFDHEELRGYLEPLKGSVAVSYYDGEYIRDLYKGWYPLEKQVTTHAGQAKKKKTELLLIRESKYAESCQDRWVTNIFEEGPSRYIRN